MRRGIQMDADTTITVEEDGMWVDGINTTKGSYDQVWVPFTDKSKAMKLASAIQAAAEKR